MIFIFIISALVVVGLILGFGLFRHGLQKNHKCSGDSCHSPEDQPVFSNPCSGGNCFPPPYANPNPIPACSGGSCFPPPYANPNPIPATGTATPPYNPPNPEVVAQGPVHPQLQQLD
ncbi:hypothetical protein NE237_001378 [Protea cynaroides]|uniref:Uncharacterized protein n=1 Tax=Protea cynaroides TaxID=273540 RepID=A0A9Q0QYC3_9MAGN|nr:hypothetical protein NE237_001378 [Protea cynaroides]